MVARTKNQCYRKLQNLSCSKMASRNIFIINSSYSLNCNVRELCRFSWMWVASYSQWPAECFAKREVVCGWRRVAWTETIWRYVIITIVYVYQLQVENVQPPEVEYITAIESWKMLSEMYAWSLNLNSIWTYVQFLMIWRHIWFVLATIWLNATLNFLRIFLNPVSLIDRHT